jgi:S-adenosylmethionine:tRNA ribosyltransferase-isomerase
LHVLLEPADNGLDASQSRVNAFPAGRDEVDEQGQVVDTRVPFAEQVGLQVLEASDGLVHQPAYLGEGAADRLRLVADCVADPRGQRFLECRGGRCQSIDLVARPREQALQRSSVCALRDPSLRAFHRSAIHVGQDYRGGRMKTRELEYDLPPGLIAQHPVARRDESRLLVYDRMSERVDHRRFAELPDVVGDALTLVNDTRVVPARIPIAEPKGEVLLLEPLDADGIWEGLARPTRRLRPGRRYGAVELLEHLGEGRWRLRLHGEPAGETPLPPYITEPLGDPGRYQTVYARESGSAAAPTAGLHFTPAVLSRLDVERVTLHVGLDTFRPVAVDDLDEHTLHGERYEVTAEAWERIRVASRVLAVGTTTVRVLEAVARGAGLSGRTELFVTPGFDFLRTDALLTNFHLPRSTLLALVMAFAGVDETRRLYRLAIEERYRFYSFGDAMLVL